MEKTNKTKTAKWEARKKLIIRGLLISLLSTMVMVIIVGGYFIYLFNDFGDKIYQGVSAQDKTESGEEIIEPEEENDFGITDLFSNTFDEPMNILVFGLDSRKGESLETGRTDTILIVTINPDTKQVAAVSFPRDTYVLLPGYDHQKLNSAYYYGGLQLLTDTIEYNFDIKIDKYFAINFTAFSEIVDILGGIDVYTPSSMYYVASDIHVELSPGEHHLNGEELLGYVRYRNDQAGDIGRIKRQQYAIRALGEKAAGLKTVIKAPEILDILGENILTDINKKDLLSIIKTYRNFSNKDWHPLTLNGKIARSEENNMWYYFYEKKDKEEVTSFVNRYYKGEN